ncbi:F-actin-capping protein subunit alpha [Trichinella pseudospiralis]|uniref:F-actin-capping protein subunit alpha n=1 Tax=Trichinella pseudospiralis TaxID=6337 RepID=A0A0V1DYG8_TRIPS|nr:F-actin-capping protein subunit alpha [Trichinella pseudospiralis]KRZ21493.1 F-actin-capping protein subunit alpha [Trichinella pseudospiralis]KRZ39946.1 F-actin-capping protein subunit alpha [Trichinella pseudospiralis]
MPSEVTTLSVNDSRRIEMANELVSNAPPGEIQEVYDDLRQFLENDETFTVLSASMFAEHNKRNFVPVLVEGIEKPVIITPFNVLNNGRIYDPRSKQSFELDHIKLEAFDRASCPNADVEELESRRLSLQESVDAYISKYFMHGNGSVFSYAEPECDEKKLLICIVNQQNQPNNFLNGHWQSQFAVQFPKEDELQIDGWIQLKVHYYEDGNVQLFSKKDVNRTIPFTNEATFANDVVKVVQEEEENFQRNVDQSRRLMSEFNFKGLRRQLPVTRSKIDWSKMVSYRVATELKPQTP